METLGYVTPGLGKTTLTPKGEAAAKGWRWVGSAGIGEWSVPVARAELIEVTGITYDEGKASAVVEFKCRWTLTPLGEELRKANPNLYFVCAMSASPDGRGTLWFADFAVRFRLRLYDDGWRVEGLA